jgi:nucleotide sugar dehydrogenase
MDKTVAVVGLGKIGLPLSVRFARSGFTVLGCDVWAERVDEINAGRNPIEGEAGLDEGVAEVVASGRLKATTDTTAAVREADYVIIIVPLIALGDGKLDFSILDAANDAVAPGLHPGVTVIYETTLPVGTTRRFATTLAERSGLTLGTDLFAAFSPERVYSGRILADLEAYPKIVGGIDPASGERAAAFYRAVLPGVAIEEVPNAEAAELVKLAETTYRDINIAFANELARYAAERGIEIDRVIALANTQPFSHIHAPGAGVGGHCIPHYPQFLLYDGADAPLVRTAREINDAQPAWVVDRLDSALGGLGGKRVLVMGISYRENVKEPTSSPGIDIVRTLTQQGATPFGHDPYFTDDEIARYGATAVELDAIGSFDAVVLQAAHDEYAGIDWSNVLQPGQVFFDGRNAVDAGAVTAAGATYLGVGRVTRTPS